MITLQQDSGAKKTIKIKESDLIIALKKYFKWRKNVTVKRLYSDVGTSDYNKFIDYLIRNQ